MKTTPLIISFLGIACWAVLIWRVRSIARMKEAAAEFRAGGMGGLVRKYGWKFVAAFVAFYLIRDVTLYLVIPWLAARGLLSL